MKNILRLHAGRPAIQSSSRSEGWRVKKTEGFRPSETPLFFLHGCSASPKIREIGSCCKGCCLWVVRNSANGSELSTRCCTHTINDTLRDVKSGCADSAGSSLPSKTLTGMLTDGMKQHTANHVLVFGASYTAARPKDLKKFAVNPTCEFHVLRHFSAINSTYVNTLVGQEYYYFDYGKNAFVQSVITPKDIQTACKTKGSKFSSNILGLATPREVLTRVQSELEKRIRSQSIGWLEKGNYASAKFCFPYDRVVGDKDVVATSDLSQVERARIQQTPRSDLGSEKSVIINTVTGVRKSKTNTISVEIVKTDALPFYFVTAYPGALGPDFPHPSQSKKEFTYNKKYWDGHVFVLSSSES